MPPLNLLLLLIASPNSFTVRTTCSMQHAACSNWAPHLGVFPLSGHYLLALNGFAPTALFCPIPRLDISSFGGAGVFHLADRDCPGFCLGQTCLPLLSRSRDSLASFVCANHWLLMKKFPFGDASHQG
ncbi:hypothetical protein V8C42DRAFT_330965 [Trichoderma barbatum]